MSVDGNANAFKWMYWIYIYLYISITEIYILFNLVAVMSVNWHCQSFFQSRTFQLIFSTFFCNDSDRIENMTLRFFEHTEKLFPRSELEFIIIFRNISHWRLNTCIGQSLQVDFQTHAVITHTVIWCGGSKSHRINLSATRNKSCKWFFFSFIKWSSSFWMGLE